LEEIMGYSCSKKAADTLDRIENTFATNGNPNILTLRGQQFFFERGLEQRDGAITGKLVQLFPETTKTVNGLTQTEGRTVGSVRISAEGYVIRFPRLRADQRKALSLMAARYDYDHFGEAQPTQTERVAQ
jgi:hypothetical protein